MGLRQLGSPPRFPHRRRDPISPTRQGTLPPKFHVHFSPASPRVVPRLFRRRLRHIQSILPIQRKRNHRPVQHADRPKLQPQQHGLSRAKDPLRQPTLPRQFDLQNLDARLPPRRRSRRFDRLPGRATGFPPHAVPPASSRQLQVGVNGLLNWPIGPQLAPLQQQPPRADPCQIRQVVRYDQQRHPPFGQLPDSLRAPPLKLQIPHTHHFVQQQDVRLQRHRNAEGQPQPHAE